MVLGGMRKRSRSGKVISPTGEVLDSHEIQLLQVHSKKLLNELCADLGICLSRLNYARFVSTPPKNPNRYADAILVAEGLNPLHTSDLRQEVFLRTVIAFQSSIDAGAQYG